MFRAKVEALSGEDFAQTLERVAGLMRSLQGADNNATVIENQPSNGSSTPPARWAVGVVGVFN